MTRHELRSNLEEIYPIAWGFRYDRNLLIVKLAPDNRFEDIKPADPYPQELYDYLNSLKIPTSKAGYSVNLIAQKTTDVLFLTEDVLQNSYRDVQTILLHELAHCLIDSEEDNLVTLRPDALALGTEFYGKLNPYNEVATRHTEYFCQVLALGAITTTMLCPCREDRSLHLRKTVSEVPCGMSKFGISSISWLIDQGPHHRRRTLVVWLRRAPTAANPEAAIFPPVFFYQIDRRRIKGVIVYQGNFEFPPVHTHPETRPHNRLVDRRNFEAVYGINVSNRIEPWHS